MRDPETGLYGKLCEQCGVAFQSLRPNVRFCEGCGRARAKASRLRAMKRDYTAVRVSCVCGRRLIGLHEDYDRCSECRKELAALRRAPHAIPRAIGETKRLPAAPPRGRR